jgi:hypothetical protein
MFLVELKPILKREWPFLFSRLTLSPCDLGLRIRYVYPPKAGPQARQRRSGHWVIER